MDENYTKPLLGEYSRNCRELASQRDSLFISILWSESFFPIDIISAIVLSVNNTYPYNTIKLYEINQKFIWIDICQNEDENKASILIGTSAPRRSYRRPRSSITRHVGIT